MSKDRSWRRVNRTRAFLRHIYTYLASAFPRLPVTPSTTRVDREGEARRSLESFSLEPAYGTVHVLCGRAWKQRDLVLLDKPMRDRNW